MSLTGFLYKFTKLLMHVIPALDIDGIKVYPGSPVNVKWLGVWYDGTVIKVGPQYNLYKVQSTTIIAHLH